MSKLKFEESYWAHHSQSLEERHKLALELIGNPKSVLDLGCGDGLFLSHVKADIKIGLDMSKTAVDNAKKKGIDARVFDFENGKLDFKKDEFDFVTLLDVLEHTFQPHLELKESAHVAKKVVVTVPNFSFIVFRLEALFGRVPSVLGERKGHVFYFTRAKLQEIFERAGLKIIKEKRYVPLMRVPIIGKFSELFGWLLPNFWSTEFAILGEKNETE